VTLAVTGNTIAARVVWRQRVLKSWEHRLSLTRSRWDIRWLSGRGKDADFVCVFLYLAWRLWKSVVTLAVTGNTISGRVDSASCNASI
jgi:hypothetical protein